MISGIYSSACVLGGSCTLPIYPPAVTTICQCCTSPRSFEGHQHVPCKHAHLRHISPQFLPRRSASDHPWRTSIFRRSIALSASVPYEMRRLCDTCIWVACVIRGSHAGYMGLAGIRCLVCPLGLPHLRPICTSSWPRLWSRTVTSAHPLFICRACELRWSGSDRFERYHRLHDYNQEITVSTRIYRMQCDEVTMVE